MLEFITIQGLTLSGGRDCCLSSNVWEKQPKNTLLTHTRLETYMYVSAEREVSREGRKITSSHSSIGKQNPGVKNFSNDRFQWNFDEGSWA